MIDKQLVWAHNNSHGFVLAKIVDIGKETLSLKSIPIAHQLLDSDTDVITRPFIDVCLADPDILKDYDDNCSLMYLNPGTLLHNLRLRYFIDRIYTFVSNILIVINPYFQIAELYSEEKIRSYIGKSLGKNPPHIFAIAEKAYRDMKTFKKNQSIIISGESGAGKTECTKHVIKYLIHSYGKMVGPLEQRIMDSNPILESFGNAKTVRNNNSSRFGKFVEIYFDDKDYVSGGLISHYLLETSRLCYQTQEDRNYHIFYQLCIGADEQLRKELQLGHTICEHKVLTSGRVNYFLSPESQSQLEKNNPQTMQILSKHGSNCYSNGDVLIDDYKDFERTDSCLGKIGLSEASRKQIYSIIAAIIHLGNIEFQEILNDKNDGCQVANNSKNYLKYASEFLGLDEKDLQNRLVRRMITSKVSRGTIIQIPLKMSEAKIYRDSLSKAIYSKLFDHINKIINESIPFKDSKKFVGVLDIAGFEFFENNSFEQFCINYCNERIQNYFNSIVLIQEQELYKREGLKVKEVKINDDTDVIELLDSKNVGIFDILDEENRMTNSNSHHFTETVHKTHAENIRIDVPRKSTHRFHKQLLNHEGFIIKHYAGSVCYNTNLFIEKNNDNLHISLLTLIQESNNPLIRKIFSDPTVNNSHLHLKNSHNKYIKGKLTTVSVSSKFRSQLKALFDKFSGSNTNFIKCIKPNSRMTKHEFEGANILHQLESSGTLEVLKLMEYGFPAKVPTLDFYNRYTNYLPSSMERMDIRIFCKYLFKSVGLKETDFEFGTSKIFFRSGKFAEFDDLIRNDAENIKSHIERLKTYIIKAKWRRVQWCTLCVIKMRKKIEWRTKNLIICQKNVRMYLSKKKYKRKYEALIKINKLQRQYDMICKSVSELPPEKREPLINNIGASLRNLRVQIKLNDDHNSAGNDTDIVIEKMSQTLSELSLNIKSRVDSHVKECRINKVKEIPKSESTEKKLNGHITKSENEYDNHDGKFMENNYQANPIEFVRSRKYNLSNWKYTELRDTINTSCDIELLESCREEFHRRLKVYHEWKALNQHKYETSINGHECRIPAQLNLSSSPIHESNHIKLNHRYFKVPFWQNSSLGILCNNGWWYAHFYGNWVARQMEIFDSKDPILLSAGKDDMQMCELSLKETGLLNTLGAEIKSHEFDSLWTKLGG
ncbi:unconventional myosin-VI-like isoform X2 [Gordionus sp. m RMFG-2023]